MDERRSLSPLEVEMVKTAAKVGDAVGYESPWRGLAGGLGLVLVAMLILNRPPR